MKSSLTLFAFLLYAILTGQNISLSQINSNTVLDFYQQTLVLQQSDASVSKDVVMQVGNSNTIELVDRTPNHIVLSQVGDYNTTFFVNPNNYPTNAEISVKGSGNHIDITGSNSISDGMRININANDMTIFMRNY